MAETRLPFLPPLDLIYKIIRLMKDIYQKEPSVGTHHVIHQVFLQLQNQINTDELQFRGFVLRMIDTYLELSEQTGYANTFDGHQQRWLLVQCPFFMEIHEALQISYFYTSPAHNQPCQHSPQQH